MEIENYTQQLFEILDKIEPKIKKICKPKNNTHQKAFKSRITEKRKKLIKRKEFEKFISENIEI